MKTYKISLMHNEGAPIIITEDQYNRLIKSGILEKAKFLEIGERSVAVHQIAQIYPIEELKILEAPVVYDTIKEYLCSLQPHEIAQYAEDHRDTLSSEAYKSIKDNTFNPSRITI